MMTFPSGAQAMRRSYIASHRARWRNDKHAAQWSAMLSTYAFHVIGSLPVQAVDTGLVLKVLEPIWTGKPETASRLRGRLESILNFAKERGYRDSENPARWRGHLKSHCPLVPRSERSSTMRPPLRTSSAGRWSKAPDAATCSRSAVG
jgi:hypothetical protein